MKKWINDIFYSFPLQLVILHLRNNLILFFTWVGLALIMTGSVAKVFGIKYLFLLPEYLGQVNFVSYFFVGLGFAAFLMTWNLTTYLLDAHHFPFLASLQRPFRKFCLNNLLIPLTFLVVYIACAIHYQSYYEFWEPSTIVVNCLGFLTGTIALLLLSSIYFRYTNKDILNFLKLRSQSPPNLLKNIAPGRQVNTLDHIKKGVSKWRVDTYLTESFKPRLVRSVAHYDSSILLSVFKQNHLNALVVQLVSLILLITLGFLIDNPYFRIPAGASIFILASIFVTVIGAISYWFDRWRISVFILLLAFINYLTTFEDFKHKNKAYGLDYKTSPTTYSYAKLDSISAIRNIESDKLNTISILNKWRSKFGNNKPKMVMICVSGGGLKASVWSMHVAQQVDSLLQGDLLNQNVLITGASGGIFGVSYLRELLWKKKTEDPTLNIYDQKYVDNISRDLLNPLVFTIISNDLFLPWAKFDVGGHTYRKDRGYIFEKQLNENTEGAFSRTLGEYKEAESNADIPLLFITPSIVNDGRRMIVSPQPVTYMTIAPRGVRERKSFEFDAIDFGRMFEKQGAANLQFTSALRMNSTYPYILPNVFLPSKPGIEVMDAGFRDNFGIKSATRFIHVFKDWINENTSGVILVQISSLEKYEAVDENENDGIIESILNPLDIAGQIMTLQDYDHDNSLGLISDILNEEMFDVIRFIYSPGKDMERATMSFHLTGRERKDILDAFNLPQNQISLQRLKRIIREPYIVQSKQ